MTTKPLAAGRAHISEMINQQRIVDQLEEFASISEPSSVGVTRLAYTRHEQEAHNIFAAHMRRLGLAVWTDSVGNTIAEYDSGLPKTAKVIGTGSHLDSVPQAGKLDGIAGVVAAMEVADVLSTSKLAMNHRVRFVAFRAEEGARFAQACNGSRFVTGLISAEVASRLFDADGVSLSEAMTLAGFNVGQASDSVWSPSEWRAFIELHVEQGPVLESQSAKIGVVSDISGSVRLLVKLTGQASHSGGTPMHLRHDPLLAAARCILMFEEICRLQSDDGLRITTGKMDVRPGSITTVPGSVDFSVDIRDFDALRLAAVSSEVQHKIHQVAEGMSLDCEILVAGSVEPVKLSHDVARFVSTAAEELGVKSVILPSGASHDAAEVSKIVSTGMIFVPSVKGLSHVPEEATSPEDLKLGTQVLLEAIIRMDVAQWP